MDQPAGGLVLAEQLVLVAPAPALTHLGRAHDPVVILLKVLVGVAGG